VAEKTIDKIIATEPDAEFEQALRQALRFMIKG
jgi:hypothetical protein